MIRYTLFVFTIIATTASAIAAITPAHVPAPVSITNMTVIQKNDVFPVFGPLVVEQCAVEDCSDVQ